MQLIHAADLHLDSSFGALPGEKARRRRQESREVLERLERLAQQTQAEAVLLSGDLFDGKKIYRETEEALLRCLSRIRARVFIAPGNHDPYQEGSPYARLEWPENVHIFRSASMESVDCGTFVVHGAAFLQENSPALLKGFSAPEDGKIHLMVLHGDVENKESPYDPITRQEIAASGLSYLALGHIHQFSGMQTAGKTAYAYPGCPEGRGFDELGEKGVLTVRLEDGRAEGKFVPLCRRCYEILRVDVTGQEPLAAIRRSLPEQYAADLYRIVLTGQTEAISLTQLDNSLQEEFFYLELQDETQLPRDIWERAGEDSLRGLFLQEMRRRYAAAEEDPQQQRLVLEAVRFTLAAMEHRDL